MGSKFSVKFQRLSKGTFDISQQILSHTSQKLHYIDLFFSVIYDILELWRRKS